MEHVSYITASLNRHARNKDLPVTPSATAKYGHFNNVSAVLRVGHVSSCHASPVSLCWARFYSRQALISHRSENRVWAIEGLIDLE